MRNPAATNETAGVAAAGTARPRQDYAIREPRDLAEFAKLAELYREVFKMPDRAVPPAWLIEDSAKAGGLTLGLWLGEVAVGFSFAFPAVDDAGRPYLYSDGLGILPAHRQLGHAHEMKIVQREIASSRGFGRIVWTFSALRSVNAHLYISRLGALGTAYLVERRGALSSEWGTEGGIPFDEFLIDWQLDSERVSSRLDGSRPELDPDSIPILTRCRGEGPERIVEGTVDLPEAAPMVAVEVAPDYQALVDRKPALATKWREQTRPLFVLLLERGYVLTDCLHDRELGRVHYVFELGGR